MKTSTESNYNKNLATLPNRISKEKRDRERTKQQGKSERGNSKLLFKILKHSAVKSEGDKEHTN